MQVGGWALGLAMACASAGAQAAVWKYVDPTTGATVYASKAPPRGVKSQKVELPNYAPTTSPGGYDLPGRASPAINSTLPIPLPFTEPEHGAFATSAPPQALPPLPGGLSGVQPSVSSPNASAAQAPSVAAGNGVVSNGGVVAVPAGPVQAIR